MEMSDWSSDVCSSDLKDLPPPTIPQQHPSSRPPWPCLLSSVFLPANTSCRSTTPSQTPQRLVWITSFSSTSTSRSDPTPSLPFQSALRLSPTTPVSPSPNRRQRNPPPPLSPQATSIFIPAGAGVESAQSKSVQSLDARTARSTQDSVKRVERRKNSYDAVSPLFLHAALCGFLSPSVPLGSAQG